MLYTGRGVWHKRVGTLRSMKLSTVELICRERGIRLTEKRRVILSAMVSADGALSAYEIGDVCREKFDLSFPPMSIYRILEFLQSAGLVHKLLLANKFILCSHFCCDHEHEVPQFLICTKCNAVKEVGVPKQLVKNLSQGAESAGFKMISPQLEVQCICHSCSGQ